MSNVRKKDIYDPKEYNKPFPTLLRELVKELKDKHSISQEKIAKDLEISRQTLSDYQRGSTKPDIDTAKKIVEKFNKWCDLNHTLDYWVGTKDISDGMPKEKILLKNSSIEKLLDYQEDERLKIAIEFLLEQKEFIETLTAYLVNPYLVEIVNKDLDWDFFFEFNEKVGLFETFENRKFTYYDIMEKLPLLAKECKKNVMQSVENSNKIFFDYIDYLKKNEMSSVDIVEATADMLDKETEQQRRKRIKEKEAFDKEFAERYKEKRNVELSNEYQAYEKTKRKEVNKDVCSRNRKGKKV